LRRAAPADPVVAPNVFLICQSKSEHIIRDDEIADVDGRTLTLIAAHRHGAVPAPLSRASAPARSGRASAPMMPQRVHNMRGPNDGTGT
jgi:hypothetical protein